MELIHTCYRIGEIDRSVAFYEALGFEERRRMPIREEAINVFMGLPGDGDRLELTYNHGVDSYELGTGYNHIALTVDDIEGDAGAARRAGHRAREAAVPRARGRVADRVRPRSRWLPDRADREDLRMAESRLAVIDCGSNSFRLVVFTYTDTWWKRTDEIHEAVRVGEGLEATGELQPEPMERALETLELYAHFCSATGIEEVRPVATSAIRDAANQEDFLQAAREALRARGRGAARPGRGALRLPGGGQLDDAGATASCSTSAAARCSSPASSIGAREDAPLVAARRRAHDRALRARAARRSRPRRCASTSRAELESAAWLGEDGRLVGVGGTVRNLAAAAQLAAGLPSYGIQGYRVTRDGAGRADRDVRSS